MCTPGRLRFGCRTVAVPLSESPYLSVSRRAFQTIVVPRGRSLSATTILVQLGTDKEMDCQTDRCDG